MTTLEGRNARRGRATAGRGQRLLWSEDAGAARGVEAAAFERQLGAFVSERGATTERGHVDVALDDGRTLRVPVYRNEFWTAKQRAASRLHEVSYRACFKPQLPRFFVERLTRPGERVYDPFLGRGTTLVESALLGRTVAGCDVNPLSQVLVRPRLAPPTVAEVQRRLGEIDFARSGDAPPTNEDLLVFYHPDTLAQIEALRAWLAQRQPLDAVDAWIQMVAVNRLTGHSPGFFSVYSMPPNQAVGIEAQRKINARLQQVPPRRDVAALILAKTASLLRDVDERQRQALAACDPLLLCGPSADTPALADGSVALVVTSPPFLDVVNYAADNWLRCWFCGIDSDAVQITMARTVAAWQEAMRAVFRELLRVVRRGGHVAFEVGEVQRGAVRLEEAVLPVATGVGFEAVCVVLHSQKFTKTANCWGVDNNAKGTNSNRIVVLRRP